MTTVAMAELRRYLLPIMLAIYLTIYFFIGERVPYDGGLGFDGNFYGHLSQDIPGTLANRIPLYYVDRILPSLIVWCSAALLHAELSDASRVVAAFHIYNSVLLVAGALAWVRLSRLLKLSSEVATIGSACLFLNWIVAKQYLYFVVQTDTTAFALGIISALWLIEKRPFLVSVAAFAASFAFKTAMEMATPLLVFSITPANRSRSAPGKWLAIAAAMVFGAVPLYLVFILGHRLQPGAAQVDLASLPVSTLILSGYVYYLCRGGFEYVSFGSLKVSYKNSLMFASIWVFRLFVLWILARYFVSDQAIFNLRTFVFGSFESAVAKPGAFIVAHIASFGPSFILLVFSLPNVMRAAASYSIGAIFFVLGSLTLAICSETRILAFGYPFLVTFLCMALQEVAPSRRFAVTFLICSLVLSRVYLPLNALGIQSIPPAPITDVSQLLEFPWQWFFMNVGPYTAWPGYCVNVVLAGSAAIVLFASNPAVWRQRKMQGRDSQTAGSVD
jgi:hypothetical protein